MLTMVALPLPYLWYGVMETLTYIAETMCHVYFELSCICYSGESTICRVCCILFVASAVVDLTELQSMQNWMKSYVQ